MDGTKKWWESTTIWGGAVGIIATIAGLFNIVISPELIDMIVNDLRVLVVGLVANVAAIWGMVDAIIGRFKADKKIG